MRIAALVLLFLSSALQAETNPFLTSSIKIEREVSEKDRSAWSGSFFKLKQVPTPKEQSDTVAAVDALQLPDADAFSGEKSDTAPLVQQKRKVRLQQVKLLQPDDIAVKKNESQERLQPDASADTVETADNAVPERLTIDTLPVADAARIVPDTAAVLEAADADVVVREGQGNQQAPKKERRFMKKSSRGGGNEVKDRKVIN